MCSQSEAPRLRRIASSATAQLNSGRLWIAWANDRCRRPGWGFVKGRLVPLVLGRWWQDGKVAII
jgi:hypothetical protein